MTTATGRVGNIAAMLATAVTLHACGGSSGNGGTLAPPPAPPTPSPPTAASIDLSPIFTGIALQGLVSLQQAPGDGSRWFAVERGGRIWVFDNDPSVATRTLFIDIDPRVDSGPAEAGLLGLAFHPGWGVNGNFEVFLSYTRTDTQLVSYVSRFRSQDGGATLDSSAEDVIMTVLQDSNNHNGGNIVFGPDGFLYAGWGDGGGAGDPLDRAQNTDNLLGTITRVDVDGGSPYAIPQDNPFAANAVCSQGFGGAACPEIYAWGLRNPWRWSFDRMNGDLWVGDVGQGAREEVDRIELGGNYGWRCNEGTNVFNTTGVCPAGLIAPIAEYDHGIGQSITGGFVYRGSAISDLQGQYVFGDFVTGRLFSVPAGSGAGTTPLELMDSAVSIAAFAEDSNGELYVLDIGGSIFRIVNGP